MKILITGCAGFIGSHLCEKLLLENNEILGLDILNEYYDINQKKNNLEILNKFKNFNFIKDDIITTKEITNFKPEIVINLAAMAGVRNSLENPTIYMRTNIEGQTHLLEECVKNNVKQYIYASSSSVYGDNKKIPFNENDDIKYPNSPYAVTKICGEIIANLYNKLYNLPIFGLRFFTVYGPRGRPDMAPYKFLSKIMNNEKFDKYGNGESYRDYTYIDDIIDGIIGVIKNKYNRTNEIYNLGNTNTVSLNQFIETCEKITNKKAIFNKLEEQKGDVLKTFSDIKKSKDDLDYNPKINLEEGIKLMYDWLKTKDD
jgi:UDP-glucuronate 4-epimerase